MSNALGQYPSDFEITGNVTTRKRADTWKSKMARPAKNLLSRDFEGSLLIDSILSQDEEKDVVSMMVMADEDDGHNRLPSFCTSTQMGGRDQRRRPASPPLSPLGSPGENNVSNPDPLNADHTAENKGNQSNKKDGKKRDSTKVGFLELKNSFNILEVSYEGHEDGDRASEQPRSMPWTSIYSLERGDRHESSDPNVRARAGESVAMVSNQGTNEDVNIDVGESAGRGDSDGEPDGEDAAKGDDAAESKQDDKPTGGDGGEPDVNGIGNTDLLALKAKLETIDEFMEKIDKRSLTLTKTVKDLEDSLTFSQQQIDDLKKENANLKKQVDTIEIEDRRTQFQLQGIETTVDKLETSTKRRNLLLEGIPEIQDRREDVTRAVGMLFDQLGVGKGINFEACYRVGPYDKNKTRPILVTFEKQADRDFIYAKRFDLKKSKEFQRVWVNEDMGPISKRKRSIVKLIAREAQAQGIDCRSGKYSLSIDKKKFDEDNLDDLPPRLHPTQLKQIQIDEKTLAYQSEFAPFSNFFHCTIVAGSHKFFCLEQAFQFLKAKILDKPLAATRIYLSRDVYYIKRLGSELGTSEKWEARKFDLMYECLKKKFDQHKELKVLLMKSGDLELVEATPDRTWGCGATLSSNVLRRHIWPGQNKHGEILMTIREEYRSLIAK